MCMCGNDNIIFNYTETERTKSDQGRFDEHKARRRSLCTHVSQSHGHHRTRSTGGSGAAALVTTTHLAEGSAPLTSVRDVAKAVTVLNLNP